jgi:hypothetical protein
MTKTKRELKTIVYQGGLVKFSIPSTWREEYEPDGGGIFHEEGPDTGTLRLNVLTMKAPSELTQDSVTDVLSGHGDGREIRRLSNGNAVATYMLHTEETGEALCLHFWEVANPLPPRHMRIGIFSYTVLASQDSDTNIQVELQLLDTSICRAEFAEIMGESMGPPAKSWWKFW